MSIGRSMNLGNDIEPDWDEVIDTEKTCKDYELLALSRMTGEQIANELTDDERKEYYRLMHGDE